jgi:Sec-independent protein secretion pathway component TatC
MTGVRVGTLSLPKLLVGTVGVVFTMPLILTLVFVAVRPKLRRGLRETDSATRRILKAYLLIQLVGAVIAWTVFILLPAK